MRREATRRLQMLVGLVALVMLTWLTLPGGPVAPKREGRRPLTMAQARAVNAAIPFVTDRPRPARPFRLRGSPATREQAVRCLATAALYEAGHDARGQKAVMQVVLNRVRLRRYPDTICGVVYEGAYRRTGCQFSFACDGSERRRRERRGWPQARATARAALSGRVFAPVGRATHYHADWIVPYWSNSLDKIAKVGTHIFYRPR